MIIPSILPTGNSREISNSPLPVNLFPLPGIPEIGNLTKCANCSLRLLECVLIYVYPLSVPLRIRGFKRKYLILFECRNFVRKLRRKVYHQVCQFKSMSELYASSVPILNCLNFLYPFSWMFCRFFQIHYLNHLHH